MKLTKNFELKEFECKCGCKMPRDVMSNIITLAGQLQTLRDTLGVPIKLTNAYRCPSHNATIKRASKNSQHLFGKAADLKVKSMAPKALADVIEKLIETGGMLQGGIGVYKTFTHYDIRKTKARWDLR